MEIFNWQFISTCSFLTRIFDFQDFRLSAKIIPYIWPRGVFRPLINIAKNLIVKIFREIHLPLPKKIPWHLEFYTKRTYCSFNHFSEIRSPVLNNLTFACISSSENLNRPCYYWLTNESTNGQPDSGARLKEFNFFILPFFVSF